MNPRALVILFVVGAFLSACVGVSPINRVDGSGNVVSEDRTVNGVTGVEIATLGDVDITIGNQEALTIEAEDNLLPYLETTVSNGILTIENRDNTNLRPTKPVRYHLTVPSLDRLAVSSSGSINVPELQVGEFRIDISSSGDISIGSLEAGRLTAGISSSGNLNIGDGAIGELNLEISSSGEMDAGDVPVAAATVQLTSSGSTTLWVTDRLDARLSSSGNVNHYGSPKVTENTSSSGKINSLGEK